MEYINPLKIKYPVVIRITGLIGVGLVIMNFLIFPRFQNTMEFEGVDQIHRIVGQKLRKNDKLIISVKAHPKTAYNDYVRVIDQLKMADAKRISIANTN